MPLAPADTVATGGYLHPGFDPNTLRVTQLRSIFVEHKVMYRSNETKAQLVSIFNSEIRPRAHQLLAEKQRYQPPPVQPSPAKHPSPIGTGRHTNPVVKPLTQHPSASGSQRILARPGDRGTPGDASVVHSHGVAHAPDGDTSAFNQTPCQTELLDGSITPGDRGNRTEASGWVYDNVFQSGAKRRSKGQRVATRESIATPIPLASQQPQNSAPEAKPSTLSPPSPSPPSPSTPVRPSVPRTENHSKSRATTDREIPQSSGSDSHLPAAHPKDLRHLDGQTFSHLLSRALAEETLHRRSVGSGDPHDSASGIAIQQACDGGRGASVTQTGVGATGRRRPDDKGTVETGAVPSAVASAAAVRPNANITQAAGPAPKSQSRSVGRSRRSISRQATVRSRMKAWVLGALAILVIATVVLLPLHSYKKGSMRIGFCSAGTSSHVSAPNAQTNNDRSKREPSAVDKPPRWTTWLADALVFSPERCAPCPEHSTCTPSTVTCERGFVISPPLALSLLPQSSSLGPPAVFTTTSGLRSHGPAARMVYSILSNVFDGLPGLGPVAFPPSCVEDAERAHRERAVRAIVINILESVRGELICQGHGDADDGDVSDLGEARRWGLQLQTLKSKVARRISIEWHGDLDDILDDLLWNTRQWADVLFERDSDGTMYVAHREARLTLTCALKLSTLDAWEHYSRRIIAGMIAVFVLMCFWQRRRAAAADLDLVSRLVQTVYDKLKDQAQARGRETSQPPYLVSLHLRDELLRGELSVRIRARIWRKVERVVESNANVRTSLEETPQGEEMRTWMWLGML